MKMKKVLLTIEGMTPDQKAFQYAVDLCKRIRAELEHISDDDPVLSQTLYEKFRKKTPYHWNFVQGSMMAATLPN